MPAKVTYPKQCGALCASSAPKRELDLKASLQGLWLRMAATTSPANKVANVAGADLVLAHIVHSEAPGEVQPEPLVGIAFVAIVEGVGRSAMAPAELTFVKYEPTRQQHVQAPFDGLVLRAQRGIFEERSPTAWTRSPLRQAARGPLACIDDDGLSAELVRFDAMDAHRIIVHRLDWDLHTDRLDEVRIKGILDTQEVVAGFKETALVPAPPGDSEVAADNGFDFMSDLFGVGGGNDGDGDQHEDEGADLDGNLDFESELGQLLSEFGVIGGALSLFDSLEEQEHELAVNEDEIEAEEEMEEQEEGEAAKAAEEQPDDGGEGPFGESQTKGPMLLIRKEWVRGFEHSLKETLVRWI